MLADLSSDDERELTGRNELTYDRMTRQFASQQEAT